MRRWGIREVGGKPRVERRSKVVHGRVLEVVWTCVPAIRLVVVAVPSFGLL